MAELCPNCEKRPGTMRWAGDLGSMAVRVFNSLPHWCELCVYREQLKHAEERAAQIPELKARIAELEAQDA